MTTNSGIPDDALQPLRSAFRGELIRPGESGYDGARAIWNGMIDKRPALIARCRGVADVIEAVRFARARSLPTAIRGGGHNVAGNALCEGGLVIDLSLMKAVRVDARARTARAEGGVTWGEFDRETQVFGLATTGGLITSTGIAGLTLGGGIGWLMREHGLTCDNLLSADVVTADGRVVTASATDNPDLLWGLKGGGGNFGVVTSFEYRLHPVSMVLGGMLIHPAARAGELLRFCRDFVKSAPDSLTTMLVFLTGPPAPFLPPEMHGKPLVAIGVCCSDTNSGGEKAIRALREFGPPAIDLVGPMPYAVLQSLHDPSAPAGFRSYWKSEYLADLTDDAIETIIGRASGMPSPMTQFHIHHLGGAVARVGARATAYTQRSARYAVNIVSLWPDPAEDAAQIAWTRSSWEALRPHGTGGAYVNFMGEEGDERVRAAYGAEAWARLSALKKVWDPENFFRLNQNIRPA